MKIVDSPSDGSAAVPPLRVLGADLVRLSRSRRLASVILPFACAGAYFGCAFAGWWPAAVPALVALSFFTYPSTSHDLVHRSLGMSGRTNEVLLCVVELLALRSGHAYRAVHLHHHARFPAAGEIPGLDQIDDIALLRSLIRAVLNAESADVARTAIATAVAR